MICLSSSSSVMADSIDLADTTLKSGKSGGVTTYGALLLRVRGQWRWRRERVVDG